MSRYQQTETQMVNAVLESLRSQPSRFLLDQFFPTVQTFDTEEIYFDAMDDNINIAPFVSPLSKSKAAANTGFQTKIFKPAYVKDKRLIRASELQKRAPGEPVGAGWSQSQRFDYLRRIRAQQAKAAIDRRLEWMAAQAILTGAVVVEGEDYPAVTVDFDRDSGHTIPLSGGARWGETNVSPVADLQSWIDTVADACGAAPDKVIIETKAWNLLTADADFKEKIDITYNQGQAMLTMAQAVATLMGQGQNPTASVADLGLRAQTPGRPIWRGRLGDVELWSYNNSFVEDGATSKLIPDYSVAVIASEAMAGIQLFGAIQDLDGLGAQPIFGKSFREDEPSAENLLFQSAPLMAPRRPNATLCATVR